MRSLRGDRCDASQAVLSRTSLGSDLAEEVMDRRGIKDGSVWGRRSGWDKADD